MLRIRVKRALLIGLMAAMLITPVAVSRGGKSTSQPVDPGFAIPMGDCPVAGAPNCS